MHPVSLTPFSRLPLIKYLPGPSAFLARPQLLIRP
jgi:hypothetical protein